jgi:hypothetical protein
MLKFNSESFLFFWSFSISLFSCSNPIMVVFFLQFRSYSHKMSNKIVKIGI